MITIPDFEWLKGPRQWVFFDDFNDISISATSGAARWTLLETSAGATQLLKLTETGGVLEVTQAAQDNDVVSLIANAGIKLTDLKSNEPIFFACRIKTEDADDVDLHVGLGIHDTSYQASAPADYFAFRLQEGGAGLDVVAVKDSVATIADNVIDVADATYIRCFMQYTPGANPAQDIGELLWEVHSNGVVRRGSINTNGNFPDDVVIFPLIQIQNGAAAADVSAVDWIYAMGTRADYVAGTG